MITKGWRRVQVTIEKPAETKDATYGSALPDWEPLVMVEGSPEEAERFWAMIRDALPSRQESVRQGLEQAKSQVVCRIRYRSDVTSAMRVTLHLDTNVVYQIIGGPAEVGRKDWIEMVLERYSSTGGAA